MKRSLTQALLIATLALSAFTVWAHPGHDHADAESRGVRFWKHADGSALFAASFVVARDERVLLRKRDGSQTWLALQALSGADQAWVQERLAEIQALNQVR